MKDQRHGAETLQVALTRRVDSRNMVKSGLALHANLAASVAISIAVWASGGFIASASRFTSAFATRFRSGVHIIGVVRVPGSVVVNHIRLKALL